MKKVLGLIGVALILCALTLGLVGCVSPTAFKIKITSPEDGAVINDSTVTVTGVVAGYTRGEVVYEEDTLRLAPEVTVNDVRAEVAEDGSFSVQVPLTEGINKIKAIAMFNNLTVKDSIKVTCNLPAPSLSVEIQSPADGVTLTESPAAVTGAVSNPEAAVEVNGVAADVNDDGTYTAEVTLNEGTNTIVASATLGEMTAEASVEVVYVLPSPTPTLSIEITSPEDGAVVDNSSLTVTGKVSDAGASVKVNNIQAQVAEDGTFSAQILLNKGNNVVKASAVLGGQTAKDSIKVTCNLPEPTLTVEITSPDDGAQVSENPVVVTGKVSEPQAKVSVNGIDVTAAEDGTFTAQVQLQEGLNDIKAKAKWNNLVASDCIKVTYVIPVPDLAVNITSPADGAELTASPASVTGTVSNAEASVTVNGVAAVVTGDGTFSAQVELTEGANTITAAAAAGSQTAEDSINVTYTPPAPLTVEITSPEDGTEVSETTATVTGTVSYPEAAVEVNGVAVEVAEDGTFTVQVELIEGSNTITAAASLEEQTAEDSITVTCILPLTIEITSPEDGAVSSTNLIGVSGTVSHAAATVKVNGVDVEVAEDGTFSIDVTLIKGENAIAAVATLDEREAQDSITVVYTGPALSLEVNTNPLKVTGKVSDTLASVKVNGVDAEVAEDGTFSAQVPLVEGENLITVVATLDGDETSYSFKVTYTPAE